MRRAVTTSSGLPALLGLLVVVALLALPSPAQAAKMPSRATWERQNAAIMKGSVAWLEDRVDKAGPDERLALNLDIDNTSLATHYARGTAMAPTLRLARRAQQLGVAVLFNTGREVGRLPRAEKLLRAAGYPVDDICGRPAGTRIVTSKQACRAAYVADGWTLVANVGNRTTDFTGGDYEKAYKLRSYGGRLS